MCELTTSQLIIHVLFHHAREPSFFSQWEFASNKTRTQISPSGPQTFWKNYPPNPSENSQRTLWALIFPCVQLHACLGGDAGVVTGLQR